MISLRSFVMRLSWVLFAVVLATSAVRSQPKQEEYEGIGKVGSGNVESEGKIWTQAFFDYGFWEQARLSAAYFVNQELVDKTRIAYFIPLSGLDESSAGEILKLVEEGKATYSLVSGDAYFSVLTPEFFYEKGDFKDINRAGIITDDHSIAEQFGGRRIVSWGDLQSSSVDDVLEALKGEPD